MWHAIQAGFRRRADDSAGSGQVAGSMTIFEALAKTHEGRWVRPVWWQYQAIGRVDANGGEWRLGVVPADGSGHYGAVVLTQDMDCAWEIVEPETVTYERQARLAGEEILSKPERRLGSGQRRARRPSSRTDGCWRVHEKVKVVLGYTLAIGACIAAIYVGWLGR